MSHEPDATRSELPASLAHELGNRLTVVAGYAELLQQRDDEKTRRAAAQIAEAADALSAPIDDLVTLLALEVGALPVASRPAPLQEAFSRAVEAARRPSSVPVAVSADGGDGDWPWIEADLAHVTRVVSSLLVAVSAHLTEDAVLRVRARRAGGYAEVLIAEPERRFSGLDLHALVDRGRSLRSPADAAAGTAGLRLYLALRLLEENGGSLSVDDGSADGPALSLKIPAAQRESP